MGMMIEINEKQMIWINSRKNIAFPDAKSEHFSVDSR
jgi:hypothetical protein